MIKTSARTSLIFTVLSYTALAQPLTEHTIIAPNCLIQQTHNQHQPLATEHDFGLYRLTTAEIEHLALAKSHQTKPCGGFMDLTDAWEQSPKIPSAFLHSHLSVQHPTQTKANTYKILYQKQTQQLIDTLNPQNMWNDLTQFSNFQTRYSGSDNGMQAANWIKSQFEMIAKSSGRTDVSIYTVDSGYWYKQPSVIAKIGDSNEPGIVIGGHMDTLGALFGRMPGADDDGSGTVTVLELARVLLNSGMHFKKPIYLVWYAAEEMGLVGSQHVVADFNLKKIPVAAVMQLDMTGYRYKNDPTIWLYDDYTNKDLTNFTAALIQMYVKQPIKHSVCGYACSDHASWDQHGIPAVLPFEAEFGHDNPDIHTANDTMDKMSLTHMTSFAKLAVAFTVELAEPTA